METTLFEKVLFCSFLAAVAITIIAIIAVVIGVIWAILTAATTAKIMVVGGILVAIVSCKYAAYISEGD
jgi:hypothetical protein